MHFTLEMKSKMGFSARFLEWSKSNLVVVFVFVSLTTFGILIGGTFYYLFAPSPDCWISDKVINGTKIFLEVHCK